MRTCPICHVEHPLTEFPKKPTGPFSWMCKACERNRASLRKHGITNQQKQQIADHHGGCQICGHEDPGSRGWNVDHDRSCCEGETSCPKCRRGILCGWCNKMLAYAFDRQQILCAAIDYLERHATGMCDWHMPLACADGLCTNERTNETYEESFVTSSRKTEVSNAREKKRPPPPPHAGSGA